MGWWKDVKKQWEEFWQQLLYTLEVTSAGTQDLPWLDTLKFFWDSLPDADKLTTAEKRRLAHSVKLMVRQHVQDHYHQELSHKHAIRVRFARREEAQAERHIEELAKQRSAEVQAMSETARQQSLVLPLQCATDSAASDDEQQDFDESGSPQTAFTAHAIPYSEEAATYVTASDQVVVDIHDGACEIVPAAAPSSKDRARDSSSARGTYTSKASRRRVAFADLHEPLLSRQVQEDGNGARDQPGYTAPFIDQEQQQSPASVAVQPILSRLIVQRGSELLLQRYLGGPHHTAVTEGGSAAEAAQQPPLVSEISSEHHCSSISSTVSFNSGAIPSSYGTADYSNSSIGRRGSDCSNATPRSSPGSTPKKGLSAVGECSGDTGSKVQCDKHIVPTAGRQTTSAGGC